MKEALRYAIFKTSWGYFGLLGTESSLSRTCLPLPKREEVEAQLLESTWPRNRAVRGWQKPEPGAGAPRRVLDESLLEPLQGEIAAYFEGNGGTDVGRNIHLVLDGMTHFTASVLAACREVRFGHTMSYSALAERLGKPGGARAVGNALARNPLPLIIPCHRIIRSNGAVGGFSATGGPTAKKKMLELERGSYQA